MAGWLRVRRRGRAVTLRHRPTTIKAAIAWTARVHRRLPSVRGGMWAIAVERDGRRVGIAVVSRPKARRGQGEGERVGLRLEVSRVAVLEGDASASGNKGACSKLYGACAATAKAAGAEDLFTSIHLDEHGTSLRAAGWVEAYVTDGGEWDRDARPRKPAADPLPKRVFFAPWSAYLRAKAKAATTERPSAAEVRDA